MLKQVAWAGAAILILSWGGIGRSALAHAESGVSAPPVRTASDPWTQVIREAASLGLPTGFLRELPASFVTIEFEDLHTYAAEYHPAEHRMVLNRTLSFNQAGLVLRPLRDLNRRDLGTLFHELFHAYLDYLVTVSAADRSQTGGDLLRFAQDRQACRYTRVLITPIVQRKGATEERELSEQEAWEALNETWAVAIGWAVWTRLEAASTGKGRLDTASMRREWFKRMQAAERSGELRGYYEPEDAAEQALTKKRYLAHAYRITADELHALLELVLEVPREVAAQAAKTIAGDKPGPDPGRDCSPYPLPSDVHSMGAR
ncbi:MAG: hypothetical protein NW703_00730 [Nitrospiraceae bacterium]